MGAVPESESTALQILLANLQANFKVTLFLWLVNTYFLLVRLWRGFFCCLSRTWKDNSL